MNQFHYGDDQIFIVNIGFPNSREKIAIKRIIIFVLQREGNTQHKNRLTQKQFLFIF